MKKLRILNGSILFMTISMTCLGCGQGKSSNEFVAIWIDNNGNMSETVSEKQYKDQVVNAIYSKLNNNPLETIILKLPDGEASNWKELAKSITEKEAIIEYIPFDQNVQNWTELICIQYHDKSFIGEKSTLKDFIKHFHKEIMNRYFGNRVTWNVIETSENDITYEWILHDEYKSVPPQHNIGRCILTKRGIHHIWITKQHFEMEVEERGKWVKLLKETVEVFPFKEAFPIFAVLSLADRFQSFLDLGKAFSDWKIEENFDLGGGRTAICYIPPSQSGACITECLEVLTAPQLAPSSIDDVFDTEKKILEKQISGEITFEVLKKSPNEIIYSYSGLQNYHHLTAVVRSIIFDHGYCMIAYKQALKEKVEREELLYWKDQLEMIKTK